MLEKILCFIVLGVSIPILLRGLKEIWISNRESERLEKEWKELEREQEKNHKEFCLRLKEQNKKWEEDRLKKKFFIN